MVLPARAANRDLEKLLLLGRETFLFLRILALLVTNVGGAAAAYEAFALHGGAKPAD